MSYQQPHTRSEYRKSRLPTHVCNHWCLIQCECVLFAPLTRAPIPLVSS